MGKNVLQKQCTMVDNQAAISLKKVSKRFGGANGVLALDGISGKILDREFVTIIGPSGCGKSTLLRIIAGLIPYEGDEVFLYGKPVNGPSSEIGVVFQTSNLLPWLSVEKNMRLGAEILKMSEDTIGRRVEAMIDMLNLKGFERHYPNQLSGGMQQRVALGQTLVLHPSVLLMDEPFGALDALTRDRLNVELLRIWEEHKQTVFFVTHSIAEAVFLSDRVWVLSDRPGRLLEDIRIEIPHPRDPQSTKILPEFGNYVLHLSRLMGVF
ncbi:MAG: ABC transporter ATP-binding protein [Desulfatiglandales bacterium]|nr:ABC transporter ATP-binding protein [Desulfatiglandales bacterium]